MRSSTCMHVATLAPSQMLITSTGTQNMRTQNFHAHIHVQNDENCSPAWIKSVSSEGMAVKSLISGRQRTVEKRRDGGNAQATKRSCFKVLSSNKQIYLPRGKPEVYSLENLKQQILLILRLLEYCGTDYHTRLY